MQWACVRECVRERVTTGDAHRTNGRGPCRPSSAGARAAKSQRPRPRQMRLLLMLGMPECKWPRSRQAHHTQLSPRHTTRMWLSHQIETRAGSGQGSRPSLGFSKQNKETHQGVLSILYCRRACGHATNALLDCCVAHALPAAKQEDCGRIGRGLWPHRKRIVAA
jgi:hypothetical protein